MNSDGAVSAAFIFGIIIGFVICIFVADDVITEVEDTIFTNCKEIGNHVFQNEERDDRIIKCEVK